jgi:hypothetical protein
MKRIYAWLFWPKAKNTQLSRPAAIAMILSNLLPIFGVLFFDWRSFPILLLYCIESMIGISFDTISALKKEFGPSLPGSIRFSSFFIFGIAMLIFQITLIMIVVYAANQEQSFDSLRNVYFIINIVILVTHQSISRIRITNIQKKLRYHYDQKNKNHSSEDYFMPKQLLLIAVAGAVVLTRTYAALLISLILIKTFLDIRFYLRRSRK